MFRGWDQHLGDGTDVYALQPPGREDRLFEPPVARLDDFLRCAVEAVEALADRPYALFGHSLGALVAWELMHAGVAAGHPPTHLFLSGCRAPTLLHEDRRDLHLLADRDIIRELRQLGGTPDEVLENAELMAMILPAVRADAQLVASYAHAPGRTAPACVRVTVFGGDADETVSKRHLEGWAPLIDGEFDLCILPGDHFFVVTERDRVCQEIQWRLMEAPPSG